MAEQSDARFTNRFVFLHGFTQTHHHWHDVAHGIAERTGTNPTLAFVDLPGHGLSVDDRTPIAEAGDRLATTAGPGTFVGYSMGGRFALIAALARPDLVERLVLIGATPGLADDVARSERLALDHDRAEQLERDGVDAFLDAWLGAPMFAGLSDDTAGLAHRRRNTVGGLAASLRTAGTGRQPSLWARLGGIVAPTLVLAGELDAKFTEIGWRMTDHLPNATFATIEAAGHAAHTERPAATARMIADWL